MKGKLSFMWRATLALVLVLSLGVVMAAPVAASVSAADVTVAPTKASAPAKYTVEFTTTQYLVGGSGEIYIEFPTGTAVHGSYDGTVKVNTVTASVVNVAAQKVTITVPQDVPQDSPVTVVLDKDTANQIENPTEAGDYTLKVSTINELIEVKSNPYTITPAADYLRVTGTATMTVDATIELTVTAYNTDGTLADAYTGAKTLVFSGPGVAPDGIAPKVAGVTMENEVEVTFVEGVSNPTVTLIACNVETTTVDVSDGTIDSTGDAAYDLDLTVGPGAKAQLAYTVKPASVTAGVETSVFTVQRQDQYANPVTLGETVVTLDSTSTWADLEFRATAGGAALFPVEVTIPAEASTVDFYYYDELADSWTITASKSGDGLTDAVSLLTVNPAAIDHYAAIADATVLEITSPQKTNTAFPVTIQAWDEFDNKITTGGEAITITVAKTDGGLDPVSTNTVKGTATVDITLTVTTLGQSITFTGVTSGKTGTSTPFRVIAGGAAAVWVDDNAAPGWYDATHFATIPEAIAAAAAGGTVNVAAGTYSTGENTITIDKQLTLKGANYGINPITGTRVAESTIDGSALTGTNYEVVEITAANVILDGFTIVGTGAGQSTPGSYAVSYNSSGVAPLLSAAGELRNNIISGSRWGIHSRGFSPLNWVISNNTIAASADGTAVYLATGEGAQITGNLITTGGITLSETVVNTTIQNNTISNTNPGGSGVSLAAAADGVTITGNTFSGAVDNTANGVRVWDGATKVSTYAIHQNNFISVFGDGDGGLAVKNETVAEVDATNNWWSSISGPTHASNTGGTGEPVDDLVVYSPWLTAPYTYTEPVTTISLESGWNLISLMLIPEDPTIETVLDGVVVQKVAGYSPLQDWQFYTPGFTSNLEQMNDGWGYWIDMGTTTATLTVTGVELALPGESPPDYDVVVGWNLIGFTSTTAKAVDVYLGSVLATVEAMYGYNAATDLYEAVLAGSNLASGQGYWLAVSETGTIYP